jgi:hypothetical protein
MAAQDRPARRPPGRGGTGSQGSCACEGPVPAGGSGVRGGGGLRKPSSGGPAQQAGERDPCFDPGRGLRAHRCDSWTPTIAVRRTRIEALIRRVDRWLSVNPRTRSIRGPFRSRLRLSAELILRDVQRFAVIELHRPWPGQQANDPRAADRLPKPRAALTHDHLRLWYEGRGRPLLELALVPWIGSGADERAELPRRPRRLANGEVATGDGPHPPAKLVTVARGDVHTGLGPLLQSPAGDGGPLGAERRGDQWGVGPIASGRGR